MRLTVFNGSPRGKESTSRFLLDHFLEGFAAAGGNTSEVLYLNHVKDGDRFVIVNTPFIAYYKSKDETPIETTGGSVSPEA